MLKNELSINEDVEMKNVFTIVRQFTSRFSPESSMINGIDLAGLLAWP